MLAKADLVVLGFTPADPAGYGRLLMDGKQLTAIREVKDATPEERAVRLCNAGVMAFRGVAPADAPEDRQPRTPRANTTSPTWSSWPMPAKKTVEVLEADADEVAGVNDRAELAAAEALFQRAARREGDGGGRDPDRAGDGVLLATTRGSAAT